MNLGNVDNFFLWINFGNDRIRTWGAGSRSKYANHCTMLPPAYPPTLSDLQLSGRVAWKVILVGELTIDHLPTRWIVKSGFGIFLFFLLALSFFIQGVRVFHWIIHRRVSGSSSFWQSGRPTKVMDSNSINLMFYSNISTMQSLTPNMTSPGFIWPFRVRWLASSPNQS